MMPKLTTVIAAAIGFTIGVMFPIDSVSKISFPYIYTGEHLSCKSGKYVTGKCSGIDANGTLKIYETTNPKGAETLPTGIVVSESDLYQHRLWGIPDEDLVNKTKYLVAFAVGYGAMKDNVNNTVRKVRKLVSNQNDMMHGDVKSFVSFFFQDSVNNLKLYNGMTFEASRNRWFAKRFLHPDIVAPYEYIFIWDEDLGVDHFNPEEYLKLVKKHGLEMSQPAVQTNIFHWMMVKRKPGQEVHRDVNEDVCTDLHLPPCASFIEIMAPVFSRNAWRCAWHMIQNDLVHGWGLDLSLRRCLEPSYEKMGVVDAQWIVHHHAPTLLDQGRGQSQNSSSAAIRRRCRLEWKIFEERLKEADNNYYQFLGMPVPGSNSTNSTT